MKWAAEFHLRLRWNSRSRVSEQEFLFLLLFSQGLNLRCLLEESGICGPFTHLHRQNKMSYFCFYNCEKHLWLLRHSSLAKAVWWPFERKPTIFSAFLLAQNFTVEFTGRRSRKNSLSIGQLLGLDQQHVFTFSWTTF
jgi:hypothetical protein